MLLSEQPKCRCQKQPKYEGVFVDLPTARRVVDSGEAPPRPDHPGAKRLMRLFKSDIVAVTVDGEDQLLRVYGFSATNNNLDV